MAQFDVSEARQLLSRLLERAHRGEEIVIAERGRPVARLVSLESATPRRPGLLSGQVDDEVMDRLPDTELDAWEP